MPASAGTPLLPPEPTARSTTRAGRDLGDAVVPFGTNPSVGDIRRVTVHAAAAVVVVPVLFVVADFSLSQGQLLSGGRARRPLHKGDGPVVALDVGVGCLGRSGLFGTPRAGGRSGGRPGGASG